MKLTVYLTPKASHTRIEGWARDEKGQKILRVKVTAVPENGKANEALIKLLTKALHISQSRISLIRGTTARIKQLEIDEDRAEVEKKLEAICC